MFDHDDGMSALEMGAAYGLLRYGQDQQARILAALQQNVHHDLTIHIDDDRDDAAPEAPVQVNARDYSREPVPEWADYVGQEPLKRQLMVSIRSAQARGTRMPHTLLASGVPGVGKTTMARLIAKEMGVQLLEIVPPFDIGAVAVAAQKLGPHDILFIDEIHKMADSGKRGAEVLLKPLEDGVFFMPDGSVVQVADITIIGATTDRDMLPETVLDRFKVKPYFQAYSEPELGRIAVQFAWKHDALTLISDKTLEAIALACRGTPRIIEEMVLAARDLALSEGVQATPQQVLDFVEVTADGLTRTHIAYLTNLFQFFRRESKDGLTEYVVGEASMQQLLRETKQGIGRVERFLIERGLIDRTPRGRRLTARGVTRAQQFIRAGKGAAHVA